MLPVTEVYQSGSSLSPTFQAQYQNYAFSLWCQNGVTNKTGTVSILSGITETWSAAPIPTPTTSTQPFDIAADWYGSGTNG